MDIIVRFADESEEVVVAYLAAYEGDWHLVGTIDSSDDRWGVFFDSLPWFIQSTMPQAT
ncbi:TPA: hypothetical protein RZL14_002219 [Yersinia enterocolitica]|nr:hypothetical protein [Yersinia enterocolitica]